MKILLVQGSPHKKGSFNILAEQFMEGAKAAGHTVSVFDAAHANLHPCNGCEACGMSGDCVQHDDMEKARQSILGSDMPVYALSGSGDDLRNRLRNTGYDAAYGFSETGV